MSDRMTLSEVERQYGKPLIKLDIHATRTECERVQEKLDAVTRLGRGREQGYLAIDCKLFIDAHDIERYLNGELDTLGEIYAFPDDIQTYRED